MLPAQLRRYVRAQRVFTGLAGLAFGVLASVFANYIFARSVALLPWVAAFALVVGLIGVLLTWRQRPPSTDVLIQSPLTLRTAGEARQYARRGFVGFVPLYNLVGGGPGAKLSEEELRRAVAAHDFVTLQIEKSNLMPTIAAITAHASALEHCWLLTTTSASGIGSRPYAALIETYIRLHVPGLKCEFHYDRTPEEEACTISLEEDALVLRKTYDLVRAVFQSATEQDIPPRAMVADMTTGIRSMALGLVLACLDKERDVEFVGSQYNASGRPEGPLYPIIFSFEPVVAAP